MRAGNQGGKNTQDQRRWENCSDEGKINPEEYEIFKME